MKTTKNIARLAVTAGLTAALSFGGVMATVTMAFAAEGAAPSYSLTINKSVVELPIGRARSTKHQRLSASTRAPKLST